MLTNLTIITIYPDFIAPLFDKFTPLPEGELRSQIFKLAEKVNFPLKQLYLVEGSKRSGHSNAYFTGFGNNKRIVLYDTLLGNYTPANSNGDNDKPSTSPTPMKEENKPKTGCTNEEVVAVLAHELGHWYYNHFGKFIVVAQINLIFIIASFDLLYKAPILYKAFGFYHQMPVIIGLIIVQQFIFGPFHSILRFLMTLFSRHFEFQADAFAKSLGYGDKLCSALVKLYMDNLTYPVFDPLFSSWYHSHPPLLDRIHAIKGKTNKTE